MNKTTYGIRIHVVGLKWGRSGFLGSDDTHIVTSAIDSRRFASAAHAGREVARLIATRGHFLAESPAHFKASVILVPNLPA